MMAGDIPQTVFLRHQGGGDLVEHDWPLHPDLAEQLAKGWVTQASTPGPATWHKQSDDAAEAGGRELVAPDVPMPHRSAPKADWQGYAVQVRGADPEDAAAATKQDLIERYGS